MEKLNSLSRRIAIFFEKYGFLTEAIGVILSGISGYFMSIASFSSSTPTTFNGENVNSFSMIDISFYAFFASITITIIGGVLWVITKNATPLVKVKPYLVPSTGGELGLQIINEEPKDIKSIRIEIVSLFDIKNKWEHLKPMGIYTIIESKEELINGQKLNVEIMEARLDHVIVKTSKRGYIIPITYPNLKEFHDKLEIVFDVSIMITGEDYRRNVGRYSGTILREQYKDFETPEGLITQNSVLWEKGSFKKLSKKEYRSFIKKELVSQS